MQLNLYVIKYNKYSGGGFSVKCLLQLSDAKKNNPLSQLLFTQGFNLSFCKNSAENLPLHFLFANSTVIKLWDLKKNTISIQDI